ncbi:MAG: erythromycin biosynthesis sensory transduction protein eryC1 [Thiotrichales bacterium SG8_50]|nr:MAG: erythromycin biosynthesis sensory transduction protein eryC1 [Thiotrichales bacterium SG8_50]
MIPMVDLRQQHQRLKDDIERSIAEVFETTQFILGPNVQAFEQEVARYLGVKHALGCASGTDALHLALAAAGIGEGDEGITTPFTFIATAEAIRYVDAEPVFVDIHPDTFNIDVAQVENAIGPRTRAVLPVHLFGQPADMPDLLDLCQRHGLILIEDCAQSFGAAIGQRMTGSLGLAGAHSFFPSKNLGCYGDGGMVTTNDDNIAQQVRLLRNHGSEKRYHHDVIGYNSRLDEIQAAILRVKLRHIDEFNRERRRVAQSYSRQLSELGIMTPVEDDIGTHVYHQYTILTPHRERIMQALAAAEIACAIYYPIPLHQQKVFASSHGHQALPHCEHVAAQCMSLPIHPELSEEQISDIVGVIATALEA